ncbi:MAG: hypothetical protein WCM76_03560 [Bacteroidota bacterium]
MKEKLLVGMLGKTQSGKTHTWNTIFEKKEVKTGRNLRKLTLNEKGDSVDVFLVNRSAQKRHMDISQIITVDQPKIVLCSLQYAKEIVKTLKYFVENDYFLYIHWLNPGYNDPHDAPLFYDFDVLNYIFSADSMIGVRNGKKEPAERVREIRDFIYAWSRERGLLKEKYALKL